MTSPTPSTVFGEPGHEQIVASVLSSLDWRDLLTMSAVCTHLNDVVTASSELQLVLRAAFHMRPPITRRAGEQTWRDTLERVIEQETRWAECNPKHIHVVDLEPMSYRRAFVNFSDGFAVIWSTEEKAWSIFDLRHVRDGGPVPPPHRMMLPKGATLYDHCTSGRDNLLATIVVDSSTARSITGHINVYQLFPDEAMTSEAAGGPMDLIPHPEAASPRIDFTLSVRYGLRAPNGGSHIFLAPSLCEGRLDLKVVDQFPQTLQVDWRTGATFPFHETEAHIILPDNRTLFNHTLSTSRFVNRGLSSTHFTARGPHDTQGGNVSWPDCETEGTLMDTRFLWPNKGGGLFPTELILDDTGDRWDAVFKLRRLVNLLVNAGPSQTLSEEQQDSVLVVSPGASQAPKELQGLRIEVRRQVWGDAEQYSQHYAHNPTYGLRSLELACWDDNNPDTFTATLTNYGDKKPHRCIRPYPLGSRAPPVAPRVWPKQDRDTIAPESLQVHVPGAVSIHGAESPAPIMVSTVQVEREGFGRLHPVMLRARGLDAENAYIMAGDSRGGILQDHPKLYVWAF